MLWATSRCWMALRCLRTKLLACRQALNSLGVLQGDNIQTLVKAAGVSVEPYWPNLFAKLFEKRSIADLITNVGAGQPSLQLRLCHPLSRPSPCHGEVTEELSEVGPASFWGFPWHECTLV